MFEKYMLYMSRFYEIDDHESWHDGAMGHLDLYENDPNRSIFLMTENCTNIGFAMVNRRHQLRFNAEGVSMAEFYIDKDYQEIGNGRKLACCIFSRFPGRWEVAINKNNSSAQRFWHKVVRGFCGDNYNEVRCGGYDGIGILFNSAESTESLHMT